MDKFNLKEFATGNNVTYIEIGDDDLLYIQIPHKENQTDKDRRERLSKARDCFRQYLPNTKVLVEDVVLKITVITKKEEFVARINDDIVQL